LHRPAPRCRVRTPGHPVRALLTWLAKLVQLVVSFVAHSGRVSARAIVSPEVVALLDSDLPDSSREHGGMDPQACGLGIGSRSRIVNEGDGLHRP
jgi:hypothetical protein